MKTEDCLQNLSEVLYKRKMKSGSIDEYNMLHRFLFCIDDLQDYLAENEIDSLEERDEEYRQKLISINTHL